MTLAMVLGMSMTTFAAPENVAGITSNITVGFVAMSIQILTCTDCNIIYDWKKLSIVGI